MLRSHSTPLTTTNSSSVLLSPRYDCKSPRSLYHSKHVQKKKKSPLSTTCFILCVFVFCLMVVLHRMEVIFVHRVGGTFSLLGSNRRGEEEKDINDASISSFPSVSSEYFYWALVTADDIRVAFFNPVLKIFVGFTAFLSALVAADRVFHLYVAFYWKYLSRKGYLDKFKRPNGKRVPSYSMEEIQQSSQGSSSSSYLPPGAEYYSTIPNVVVQLPMFNETACCEDIINAACRMKWPREHFMVQVLDDSTELEAREIAQSAVHRWMSRGINIQYVCRENRKGYKAGSMVEAMDSIENYEYVAVFDADFDPDSDFLFNTVPWLMENEDVGFVQTRWTFTNAKETVLTRVQEISLSYHMLCEQYARCAAGLFFNFNGTAGVWRRKCIVDSGGWNFRTTVEDMDLSLRAYLKGWKFIFLNDITCDNEIPAEYDAYRKQQHRWSCGPMQLWRKATKTILESNGVSMAKKLYLIVFFFGARMFAAHIVSFFLYCLLVPLCAISPEIPIPFWALVYAPVLVTMSTVVFTKDGWKTSVAFVLFENAMSVVKLSAMISGLFELSDAHEWVVTKKLGNMFSSSSSSSNASTSSTTTSKVCRKIYFKVLSMGLFFLFCGVYGILQHQLVHYSLFLIAQSLVFFAFGLNRVAF